jgi:hypothetical protein
MSRVFWSFCLSVAALWGAPGAAEVLRGPEDVARLCASLDQDIDAAAPWDAEPVTDDEGGDELVAALREREAAKVRARMALQPHEVELSGAEYSFLPYADDVDGLPLAGGPVVSVQGLDLELRLDVDAVGFRLSRSEAEELEALRAMGGLALRVVFDVDLRGAAEPVCSGSGQAGRLGIPARLIEAQLIETLSQQVRAELLTPHGMAARARLGGDVRGDAVLEAPRAEVTGLESLDAATISDGEAHLLRVLIEAKLLRCYATALVSNAQTQGALVLGFSMEPAGRITTPAALIDVLGDAATSRCATAAIDRLQVPRPEGRPAADLRATVIFRRM